MRFVRDRAAIPLTRNQAYTGRNTAVFRRSAMSRPISWLPRLHEIRRSVAKSVRSHYSRTDLQTLFGLQPRAAQKLLEMLPTVAIGTSRLVDREALSEFLERVHGSDDAALAVHQQRAEAPRGPKKRLRSLVRTDAIAAHLSSPPQNLTLEPGRIEIRFETIEDLAQTLFSLAQILDGEEEEFASRYEPQPEREVAPETTEVQRMFLNLRRLEEQQSS